MVFFTTMVQKKEEEGGGEVGGHRRFCHQKVVAWCVSKTKFTSPLQKNDDGRAGRHGTYVLDGNIESQWFFPTHLSHQKKYWMHICGSTE